MKKRVYPLKRLLFIMLTYFVAGLGYTMPFFFDHHWLSYFISMLISFFILIRLQRLGDELKGLCPSSHIFAVPLSALLSGFIFGFVGAVSMVEILEEYRGFIMGFAGLGLLSLLCSFAVVYRMKPLWDMPNKSVRRL